MQSRSPFQRRFLFGYDPAEVDHALRAIESRAASLEARLAESERRCRALEAAAASPATAGPVTRHLPVDASGLGIRRGLFGYRRRDVRSVLSGLGSELERAHHDHDAVFARLRAAQQELDSWRRRQEQLEALSLRATDEAIALERRTADEAARRLARADQSARRTLDDARAEARRLLEEARPRIEEQRAELARLQRFQRDITEAIRAAMLDFERSLVHSVAPLEASGMVELVADAPVAATVHDLAEHRDALPADPAPDPEVTEPRVSESPAGVVEARRLLQVTPLRDYAELARLVRRLTQVEQVEDVFVQSFDQDAAELAVHLAPGASLDEVIARLDGAELVGAGSEEATAMSRVRLVARDHG